jgi:hypothetical protein
VELLLDEHTKNPYPAFYERRGDERRERVRCSHAGAPHQHRTGADQVRQSFNRSTCYNVLEFLKITTTPKNMRSLWHNGF